MDAVLNIINYFVTSKAIHMNEMFESCSKL